MGVPFRAIPTPAELAVFLRLWIEEGDANFAVGGWSLSRTNFSRRGEALKPRLGLLTLIDRPWQFISLRPPTPDPGCPGHASRWSGCGCGKVQWPWEGMMNERKLGRNGDTVIRNLPDGAKLSITQTPAGLRAHLHQGDITTSVDPAGFGIAGVKSSTVGGDNSRVTIVKTDGTAIDVTRHHDGSTDECIHDGGQSRKP